MSHVSDGFFAFPPSFPHQQRILQFSLALFVSCDKILSKTERYDNTMRKTALPTDRLSETARQKLSRFEAWRSGMENLTRRSVPISILPGIFFPCTPKSHMTI